MDKHTITGIEQGRAKFAYDCADEVKTESEAKKYKAYVKKLPMLIKTNGLGSALAFVKAKSGTSTQEKSDEKKAYEKIYHNITQWFKNDKKQIIKLQDNDDLVNIIINLKSNEYRFATIETLSFLVWLRRFAEGLIEGEDQG